MKLACAVFLSFFCVCVQVCAQGTETETEAEKLGSVAGAAQACKAYKNVFTYEEIASRLIASMAASEDAEKIMMKEYVDAKARSYIQQRTQNRIPCGQLINTFVKMPIFKFELYSDGTLKTPEGKFIYPRGQKGFQKGAYRTYPAPPRPQQLPPPMPPQNAPQNQAPMPYYQDPAMNGVPYPPPPPKNTNSAFKTPKNGFRTPPSAALKK